MRPKEYLEYGRREEFNLLEIVCLWSEETGESVRSIFETLIKLIQDNSKNKDNYIQIWGEPDGNVPPRSLTIEENENALITCLKDFLAEDITEERMEEYHPLLHQLYLRREPQ